MIPTRAPEFIHAPAAPLWLDPNHLGATKLIRVKSDRVRVITEGEGGLLKFLTDPDLSESQKWDAYVVLRPSLPEPYFYVYSRHQFWLAANTFLATYGLHKSLLKTRDVWQKGTPLLHARRFLRIEASAHRRLGLLVQNPIDEQNFRNQLGQYFDLHEYAVSAVIRHGEVPDRPGLHIQPDGSLMNVYVPDTSGLGKLKLSLDAPAIPGVADLVTNARRGVAIPRTRVARDERATRRSQAKPPEIAAPAIETEQTKGNLLGTPSKPAVAPPATATRVVPLRRFPHLDLSESKPLKPAQEFQVIVYIDESAPRVGEETQAVVIQAPPEIQSFPLGTWLVATEHFEIRGPDSATITLRRDTARSDPVSFTVVVRSNPPVGLTPRLTAIFQYQGRPCGSISVTPELATPTPAKQPPGGPGVEVHFSARPADLTVLIANPSGNGRVFSCRVTTPLLPEYKDGVTQEWELPQVASEIVANHFKLFTTPGLPPTLRIANLLGAGGELFKVAPPHFKEAFWRIIDQKAPLHAISIVSAEAHIPWELMVPNRIRPDATRDVREPLGVEFAVGRWVCEDFLLPPQRIPLHDSWVFAPRYDPNKRPKPLAKAGAESALVLAAFSGAEISPAVFDGLEAAMTVGGRSLLHFVCHGSSPGPGAQAIICEDLTELSATAVGGAAALGKACAASRPLVFLNACEVGRTTPALVGTGGFGPAFIQVGASGVLAPLWSVKDTIAHDVACEFYGAIRANPTRPFANVLQAIRARAYAVGGTAEDTYAAYCFYGDPHAAIA